MDLLKQYISQCISVAANNLRLTNHQIEVVALLRELINYSAHPGEDFKQMKKITEVSTLAIRLDEIYSYLTQKNIDMLKLSENFRKHSQFLIKDLSHMLDRVHPEGFKKIMQQLSDAETEKVEPDSSSIDVDLSKRKTPDFSIVHDSTKEMKEEIILGEEEFDEERFYQNYESEILNPIKPLDQLLKQLNTGEVDLNKLQEFASVMQKNGENSARIGFEIIASMHKIVAKALFAISRNELTADRETIESLRACLIVIVAVVRGKDVDITNFLNRAEDFGRKISTIKSKDTF
ncbi:MAG: hypothetical protein Kow0098_09160 [Ignavibacteriaceae bacterium]